MPLEVGAPEEVITPLEVGAPELVTITPLDEDDETIPLDEEDEITPLELDITAPLDELDTGAPELEVVITPLLEETQLP